MTALPARWADDAQYCVHAALVVIRDRAGLPGQEAEGPARAGPSWSLPV